jgi:hypothetical protein
MAARDDKAWIERPWWWTHLALPLKRTRSWDSAYILPNKLTRVYSGNIFTMDPNADSFKDYDNIDAILADGWRVD